MCEFCGHAGVCIVCGHNAELERESTRMLDQACEEMNPERLDNPPASIQRIAALRARAHERDIAATRERLAKLIRELPAVLVAAGRRPGDGSDQESLFATEPADLFAEV